LSPALKGVEFLRAGSIGGSIARYTALRRFLRERADELTLESLMELTRNHTSYPRSICAHGAASEPEGAKTRTVSAMIQALAEGTIHVTDGCACESDYAKVSL
jgi:isopenicillin-N N-acyltransferase-like protein